MTAHEEIAEMLLTLSDLPATDLLVNCAESNKLVPIGDSGQQTIQVDHLLRKILLEAISYQREADVNSLCVCRGTIKWNDRPGMRTPLFVIPLEWSWKRSQSQFSFEISDALQLNPFVRFYLSQLQPDLEIPSMSSVEEAIAFFTPFGTIENQQFLGNFHVDRFSVFRDLKGISQETLPDSISELNGECAARNFSRKPLDLWFSSLDRCQRNAVHRAEQQSLVIQGPPGTGKSQVLLNLIGRSLIRDERLLVVSEKKTALDVLEKKLQELNLDSFSFVVHAQTSSSELLDKLRKAWKFAEEHPFTSTEIPVFDIRLKGFQQLIDRLESKTLLGGLNFYEYRKVIANLPEVPFVSTVPDMKIWQQYETVIDYVLHEKASFLSYKQRLFQVENAEEQLSQAMQLAQQLQITTLEELELKFRSIHRCVLLENVFWSDMSVLVDKPKEAKRFRKLVLEANQVAEALQVAVQEMSVWTRIPTSMELEKSARTKRSFWKKNPAKKLSKLLRTPVDLKEIVQKTIDFHQKQVEQVKLHEKIRGFGFEPGTEAVLAMEYIRAVQQEDWTELKRVASWSSEERKTVIQQRSAIESLQRITSAFIGTKEGDLPRWFDSAVKLLNRCHRYRTELAQMPSDLYKLLGEFEEFRTLKATVVRSNFSKAAERFPELAQLNGIEFGRLLDELSAVELSEIDISVRTVYNRIVRQFHEADELLRNNPAKLKEDRKALRSRLKKGKALLVKEFSKTKSHPSIRELLESDAKEWIQLLLPVWMATPAQVADHFPLEKESFDFLLIDEGSQMPLPNAYGALFRSKSVAIAGDDKQMSPSSYFGKSVKWHDVFHQAEYHLEKVSLNHHYRSAQPELIAFSNRYFYNNELITFPPAKREKSIFLHSGNGVYSERINTTEARAVRTFLENFDWKKSLGLVAFSAEQLKCILSECSPEIIEKLEFGQENGSVFVKTLEQVQGDEASTVVISMGYGKNPEGQFRMQFGPVNQSNGFKRLNVLFSRAQESLHFFTSVNAEDFALSENEGVTILRRFLQFAASEPEHQEPVFPFGIEAKINGNALEIPQISSFTQHAGEILTFHQTMQKRGWKINYEI